MATTSPATPHGFVPGSIRAAWSYRQFRLLWLGSFGSNTGTWMQNVALPAYIVARTHSGFKVGVIVFAQLGPQLLLAIPAGVLATRVSRRRLLVTMQAAQLAGSLVLAWMISRDASFMSLFFVNAGIGVASALNNPAFQSAMPELVDRADLPGAIALNSAAINGTRVLGPVLAALLALAGVTIAQIFVINAATYLFVIAALLIITFAKPTRSTEHGWRQMTVGVRIARRKPIVGRILVSMAIFALFTLVFVGQFAKIADSSLHLNTRGSTYLWLYSVWGFGAFLGAVFVGSVLARTDKRTLVPFGFLGVGVTLAIYALQRNVGPAFPSVVALGFFYFWTATSLATVLQQNLTTFERPFVMSLWFMAFGGCVPLGNLAFGPVIDHFGARGVLLGGAASALFLAWFCDLRRRQFDPEETVDEAFETADSAALDQHGIVAAD
jgi:MFS family permease